MKNSIRVIAVALSTLAAFAVPVWAQTSAPATQSATPAAPATTSHAQKHQDVVEQRIADMHTQMSITDQESKQWDAFAQTMRDNAKSTSEAFHDRARKLPTMNAVDAMKSYAALTELHAKNMEKLSSAMSDLYAVMSDDQKEVADSLYRNETAKSHKGAKKPKSSAPASAASPTKSAS